MAALVLLYTKCEWFRDVVNAVVQKIVSFFTETIPQAWGTLMDFLSGVPEWWSGIWQQVSDFFMQIWNGIVNFFYRNNTAGMEQRCYIFFGCSGVVVRYLAADIRFLCKYLDDNDAESGYIRNCDNDHNTMAECG